MTMAPTIALSRCSQISVDVVRPRNADIYMLGVEKPEEVTSHRNTSARRFRGVPFLLQVIAQFPEARLESEVVVRHVHLQMKSREWHTSYAKQLRCYSLCGLDGRALLRITNS
jgi:hypothetical protein